MYYIPQIKSHGMDFSCHEPETLTEFMSEYQVSQFSTQVGLEKEVMCSVKKSRVIYKGL